MDFCHQIIQAIEDDALAVMSGQLNDEFGRGNTDLINAFDEEMRALTETLIEAPKFDVTALIPFLTNDLASSARRQHKDGQLHMPFPIMVLSISEVEVLDYSESDSELDSQIKRIRVVFVVLQAKAAITFLHLVRVLGQDGSPWSLSPFVGVIIEGDVVCNKMHFASGVDKFSATRGEMITTYQQAADILGIVSCLSSRNVESATEEPPARLNKARAKNGDGPLFSHTVTKINLSSIERVRRDQGGTHAPPRLHWRMGHQRVLRAGREEPRVTRVRPHLVGDIGRGSLTHDYIVVPPKKDPPAK